MSSSETVSIIVWCWHDRQTNTTLLRAVHVNTAEEVPLRDGSFLLRFSLDESAPVQRCYIRHIASGREAYVQGGPNLRTFVKDCLLKSDTS
jgi:hypothetical protein